MARIRCIQSGGVSIRKKAKVWFCSHPEDRELFLAPVSNDIMKTVNCTVWYDDEPYAEYDENFFCDLSQMQLFVMPVTEKLLRGGNRALDVEFRYAMEHHIPVLPLMQGQNLEALFNEKCGDLQFLDKSNADVTAISYGEKLEKYLRSIIIGDELAKKVRDSFRSYIFLSYRKKDRKYAQELMRLIHKNEFCRDVAIWYDEFLTPGENFNDSIAEALGKSELFVLAVTPNLVNEKNYVMTVEYPEACKAGKKILPAELVATDGAVLAEKYPGIAPATDARDEGKLAAELAKVLGGEHLPEKRGSAEHLYYMGLAYLGGIDVEKDGARARSLLENAARGGYDAALKKLSDMYKNGEGVPRDLGKAIIWQKTLTEKKKRIYEQSGESALAASQYASALNDLGILLSEARRWEEALEAFSPALEFAGVSVIKAKAEAERAGTAAARLVCLLQTNAARGTMTIACDGMIIIYRSRMMREKLLEYSELELDILNEWERESPGNNVLRFFKKKIYSTYAFTCRELGRYAEAEKYYLLRAELLSGEAEGENSKELAGMHLNLAETMLSAGERKSAEENLIKALELSPPETHDECKRLGDIAFRCGKSAMAKRFYLDALGLAKLECEKEESVKARRNVYLCHKALADVCEALGEAPEQKIYFEEYGRGVTQLAKESGEREVLYDLAAYSQKLGSAAIESREDAKKAEENLLKAAGLMETLINDEVFAARIQILCIIYRMIAAVRRFAGDIVGAHAVYKRSIDLCRKVERETERGVARELLLDNYASMAELCEEHGSLREALGYCEKSLALREEEREAEQSAKTALALASAYADLGRIHKKLDEKYEAREFYEKEVCLREAALSSGEEKERHLLALACVNLAGLSGFFKKRGLMRRALAIWQELCRERPEEKEYARRRDAVKKELKIK